MNTLQFLFLSLRENGFQKTLLIVWSKLSRTLTESSTEKRIQKRTARVTSDITFTPILPLTPTTASRFIKEFPEVFSYFAAASQQLHKHTFKLLSRQLAFGKNINWHLDVESGKEWPKKKYRETAIYDRTSPGDVKLVWELNRHQHFVTLAQTFYLSGDQTYLDELVMQWSDWIENNPFRIGINWASPLEISIRLISWTLAYQFIEAHLKQAHRIAILQSIFQHISYLATHLSTDKIVRTNHLIGETAGLFVAASCYSFNEALQWRKKGRNILESEIQTQTFSDGVSKEQSSSYHRFVVDFLLLAFLAGKTNSEFSNEFRNRLYKMIEYLQRIQTPEYTLPPYGDCDNGRGFILAPNLDFWNVRGEIATGFSLLGNGKNFPGHYLNEESFWLLNEEEFNAGKSFPTVDKNNILTVFQKSCHVVIRSNETPSADFCFFRSGEFGIGGSGFSSHSHNDLFSPIIYLFGNLIFTDTGTSVYVGNDIDRDYLRSGEAHNSIVIDDARLFESRRWFGWRKVVSGRIIQTTQTENEIRVRCGYEEPAQIPYTRDIMYLSTERKFCIEDTFLNTVPLFHCYFHLHTSINVDAKTDHIIFLKNARPIAQLTFPKELRLNIENGWISRYYGEKIPSTILHFIGNAISKIPITFTLSGAPE
jgi:hypothetical protein